MDSLITLSQTDITQPIPQDVLLKALSTPPFIPIPGTFNFRDMGLATPKIRPGIIYRSGTLSLLTDDGKKRLHDILGVRTILDLRSARERGSLPAPEIEGIEYVWIETERKGSPVDLANFVGEKGGESGYREMYLEYLDVYAKSYRFVFEYIRDEVSKGKGILFHCHAGRDRTGVLAALIQAVAGVPDAEIANDYTLTRVGLEPKRDLLAKMFLKDKPDLNAETPGFAQFANMKPSYMLGFLDAVREKYGSLEGYILSLGFGEEDLEKIRSVLRG